MSGQANAANAPATSDDHNNERADSTTHRIEGLPPFRVFGISALFAVRVGKYARRRRPAIYRSPSSPICYPSPYSLRRGHQRFCKALLASHPILARPNWR
jgi:hypothetical protein